jgi:hypothetical protein
MTDSIVVVLTIGTVAKLELIAMNVLLIAYALNVSTNFAVNGQYVPEDQRFVREYSNTEFLGNWTYIEKPMFPIIFNESQIPIGQNWSVVCPLRANRSYHVYCYGDWINESSEPKTDYDIYVYNDLGIMEGYHTESAGLPEHLGNNVDDAFFIPEHTGNYTFVIANDPRESKGAEQATFMIVEDVECNLWNEHYTEGKDSSSLPVLRTSWGYEFVTESQHIELFIKVPEPLDMYEARLYMMSDPRSENETVLNGVPLPWEPGLFGNRSKKDGLIGGYNLESKEYRGAAYASCEFYGEDMFLNFTSPFSGKSLYHLVLIGEIGSGTIDFLVKTEFGKAYLEPSIIPGKVYPQNETPIAFVSNLTNLENATLQYTTDGWQTKNVTEMNITNNETCEAVIPGQTAGTVVNYTVEAFDTLENVMTASGTYSVKDPTTLILLFNRTEVRVGEDLTISGLFTPSIPDIPITAFIASANESKELVCYTLEDGAFSASFKPETLGTWIISAKFNGSASLHESSSPSVTVEVVEPPFAKYSLYIFGGIGAAAAVSIVIYVRKSRS